ncbi:hypothetical protein ACWDRR_43315 [Kitasatospora sp. NPDC003701]
MPSLLNYQIMTDPTSLQASSDGAPSVGTIYVIVSNTHQEEVSWRYIDVGIPIGPDPDRLTDDRPAITPSVTTTYNTPWDTQDPKFEWDDDEGVFRAQHSAWPGKKLTFPGQQSITLKLANIPVTRGGGPVLLTIRERTGGGDQQAGMPTDSFVTTLAVVKQTPKVPRNFRPTRALLEEGAQVELKWDGPSNLDYWIRFPDGQTQQVAQAGAATPAVDQPYTWPAPGSDPVPVPKRGTTYTLIAGTSIGGQAQHGYFLTTTVHALVPEFESGTRTPWIEGTADKGRVTFTTDGVKVDDQNHALGTVLAKTADVLDVRAGSVKGRTSDSGWIDFPDTGIDVYHGLNKDLGVVTADRADVSGVNTQWVGDRAAGSGWLEFPKTGAILHKDGTHDLGTLTADKADLNGLNTQWVGDRDHDNGWLTFPRAGINVHKDGGQEWGTIAADKADLNGINTKWVQGRATTDGWIEFPTSGVRVYRDGGHDLGTLTADKADLNGLNTLWVGDRDHDNGWLAFPRAGINVHKDGGQEWGTIAADKADLNGINTKWVQGRATTDGWIEFPTSGVRVYRDGGHDLGDLTADKANVNELHAGEGHVKGLLTVGGGMQLSHDGERMFVTMPDRILFFGINEFKKWVSFERGVTVAFGKGNVSMTKDNGMLVSGSNVQIQQGTLSISTGNPPKVREL